MPFAQTSENAAKILGDKGIFADLVHVDAAHEYEPVLQDALNFWKLLKPGGALIGDDYHPSWPGVIQAATEFSQRVDTEIEVREPKWIARKRKS